MEDFTAMFSSRSGLAPESSVFVCEDDVGYTNPRQAPPSITSGLVSLSCHRNNSTLHCCESLLFAARCDTFRNINSRLEQAVQGDVHGGLPGVAAPVQSGDRGCRAQASDGRPRLLVQRVSFHFLRRTVFLTYHGT